MIEDLAEQGTRTQKHISRLSAPAPASDFPSSTNLFASSTSPSLSSSLAVSPPLQTPLMASHKPSNSEPRPIWLPQFCFHNALLLSFFLQFMLGTALYLADPELFQNDESSVIMSILCIFVESLHVIAVVYASRYMLMRLQEGSCHPKSLFCMYLTNVLMFGGAHLCLFVASGTRSHQISGLDLTSDSTAAFKNVVDVFISFYYYAVVIMTSTGFGDMIPLTWYAQLAAIVQMGIALIYSFGLFSVGLSHWQHQERRNKFRRPRDSVSRCCKRIRIGMPAVERVRKFCVRNILLVSAFLQGCVLLLLIVLEQDKITDPDKIDHSVVNACIVTQVAQCALVMATSFRVVRKINSKSITPYFLISSYLSSALLFGGIFFMLFLLDSSAFQFPDTREEDNTTDITLHRALFRFLYFSFVGQTSLGFGDIIPSSTITRVVVMTQLLLNVVYTFVILGLGLSSIQKKPLSPSYSSPHSGYHRSVSSGAEAYRIQRSSSGVGGGSDQTEIGDGLGDGSGVEKKSSAASGAICAVAELNAQRGGYSMAHMLPELDGSARYQGNRSHQRQVSHLAVTAMQLEYETDSSDEEYDRDVGVTHALSMQNRL